MKTFLLVLTMLCIVPPVTAVAVNFSDSFEYAEGVGDSSYAANWQVIRGQNRYPIATRVPGINDPYAIDGTKVAYGAIPAPTGGYGISHTLGAVVPTNANPLVVHTDFHTMAAGTDRDLISLCLEMSQGDVHAPTVGTVLTSPIPVIALATAGKSAGRRYQFFNGLQWEDTGIPVLSGALQWNWQRITMTFTDNGEPGTYTGKDLALHMENLDLTLNADKRFTLNMPSDTWTAGEFFDTISLRSFPGVSYNSCIDSTSVTGGEAVPEPLTMLLVGAGAMLTRRRRSDIAC